MKLKRYIYGLMLLGGMFCLGSCQDELLAEGSEIENSGEGLEDDGMVEVKLSLSLAPLNSDGTRVGDGDSEVEYDLTDFDLLVYALRDEKGNVLYQYGQGIDNAFRENKGDDEDGNPIYGDIDYVNYPAFKNYKRETNDDENATDNSQSLLKVRWTSMSEDGKGPYEIENDITLRVMRGTEFQLSCWVQSSKTEAFDFNNLTAVKVNYTYTPEGEEVAKDALNNDVLRDAFCASSTFSIGQVDSKIAMTLSRPFAQINVAVNTEAGFGTDNKYKDYTQSAISLNGVAQYFNVVENKAWSAAEYKVYMEERQDPTKKYSKYEAPEDLFEDEGLEDGVEPSDEELEAVFKKNITFGYADMLKEGGNLQQIEVNDYSSWTGSKPDKKTYNSLSTCYVLVPEATYKLNNGTTIDDTATGGDKNTGGVIAPTLEPVKIFLKAFHLQGGSISDVEYPKDGNEIELEVKRNWRTNILFENWEKLVGE